MIVSTPCQPFTYKVCVEETLSTKVYRAYRADDGRPLYMGALSLEALRTRMNEAMPHATFGGVDATPPAS